MESPRRASIEGHECVDRQPGAGRGDGGLVRFGRMAVPGRVGRAKGEPDAGGRRRVAARVGVRWGRCCTDNLETPPLVRRVAVALELAVFLALTALVASFLDPHFAPSNTRGVGIFAGMLVLSLWLRWSMRLPSRAQHERSAWLACSRFARLPAHRAACVLVSRLLDFVPGYLFGLVAGFAVLGALEAPSAVTGRWRSSPSSHRSWLD